LTNLKVMCRTYVAHVSPLLYSNHDSILTDYMYIYLIACTSGRQKDPSAAAIVRCNSAGLDIFLLVRDFE
jgi:hypothetical protein